MDNSYDVIANFEPYLPENYSINIHRVPYNLSDHKHKIALSLLMDYGSNYGVAGRDLHVMHLHLHMKVNIEGIAYHQLSDILLAIIGGIVTASIGPALVVQYVPKRWNNYLFSSFEILLTKGRQKL